MIVLSRQHQDKQKLLAHPEINLNDCFFFIDDTKLLSSSVFLRDMTSMLTVSQMKVSKVLLFLSLS